MVRVITGSAKGKKLLVPHKAKPISDRAKGSIFSIIGSDIQGKRILDLYAGSGSLGIEALSRGAKSCTFVEANRFAVDDLKKNLAYTKLEEKGYVTRQKALPFLDNQEDESFDIVFADPPFEFYKNNPKRVGALLDHISRVIPAGGAVVLKHPRRLTIPESDFLTLADQRDFGESRVSLWVKMSRST